MRARKNAADVGISLLLSLILLGLGTAVSAQEVIEQEFEFDIPRQAVDTALTEVAEQADLTLVFPDDLVRKKSANPLIGRYTLQEGVDILLAGTGLTPLFSDHIVLSISADEQLTNKGNTMHMKRKVPLLKRLGTAIAAAIFASSGGAAVAADDATDDSNEVVIEEIVVTATKRETTLRETPLSITAFSGEALTRQGIENYNDIAIRAPGVVAHSGKHFQKFTIRGINTTTDISTNGFVLPVNVYLDDIPLNVGNVMTPDSRFYDIERVEVLRGPQGTAFGSGAMAGAVRVIANKANLDGFDASFRADLARTTDGGVLQRYNGMVNVPISDTLALRVVGNVADEEGWVDNLGEYISCPSPSWDTGFGPRKDEPISKEWGIRASLRWEPSDYLAGTFAIMHDELEGAAVGAQQDATLGHRVRRTGFEDFQWYENTTFSALFEVETDSATLVSSTSFSDLKTDWDVQLDGFIPTVPFTYGEYIENRTFVQELRILSKGEGPLQWLAGVYYLNRNIDLVGSLWAPAAYLDFLGIDYSGVSNAPRSSHADPNRVDYDPNILIRTNQEIAIFGELTYQLTDTLSLTAGLRYTETEYINHTTSEGFVTNILDMMINQTPGVPTITPDVASSVGTGTQTAATPKLTLSWQPNDAHNIYITAAKGFRRAHPNALPPDIAGAGEQVVPALADSDELWNYELGLKSRFLDGRVQANVAVYQIDWKDIQISATRVSDGYPFLVAGGDVESTGLEVELFALPTENLELGFSLTLADAKVDSLTQEEAASTGLVLGHKTPAPETQYTLFGQYT